MWLVKADLTSMCHGLPKKLTATAIKVLLSLSLSPLQEHRLVHCFRSSVRVHILHQAIPYEHHGIVMGIISPDETDWTRFTSLSRRKPPIPQRLNEFTFLGKHIGVIQLYCDTMWTVEAHVNSGHRYTKVLSWIRKQTGPGIFHN